MLVLATLILLDSDGEIVQEQFPFEIKDVSSDLKHHLFELAEETFGNYYIILDVIECQIYFN